MKQKKSPVWARVFAIALCLSAVLCLTACGGGESALTLDSLKSLKTKEEMAEVLGVADAADLEQMLAYLNNYHTALPAKNDASKPVTEWHKTPDGYKYLTVEEAKTLVTPYVITKENWKDFFETRVEEETYYVTELDGSEVIQTEEEPKVDIKSEYSYGWDKVNLTFINKLTKEKVRFASGWWSESIRFEDGKYIVDACDEDGYLTEEEFSFDNYECIYADGIVYTCDIAQELLYLESYDEALDDWVMTPVTECEEEYDIDYAIVLLKTVDSLGEYDLAHVSYESFGSYVYSGD